MGLTIHYRGRLADLSRIEDFEDRVLDLVLEIGGTAEIWRSAATDDPSRMVRGILATLAPGQETTSLLVSPEGWLIGLFQIKDAERGLIEEPPWCRVKTQFGPVEAHVALVELLRALDEEFLAELEVSDEGEYWESRDLPGLIEKHAFVQSSIDGIKEGLERHGLSSEAAEDPEIVARRIERIAEQVHRVISRPSEHPDPFCREDDESELFPDPDEVEARWDAVFRYNRRRQERLHRAIEERLQQGEPRDEALRNAFRDVGIPVPGDPSIAGDDDKFDDDGFDDFADIDEEEPWSFSDEAWTESLDEDDEPRTLIDRQRDPLLQRAMDLLHRLHDVFNDHPNEQETSLRTLFQGAGDLMGGLSQATAHDDDEDDLDADLLGLHVVQLKRALRGAAFARSALFQLRGTVAQPTLDELHETLRAMERDVFQFLGETRSAMRPGE
jgi:hypothetical protein